MIAALPMYLRPETRAAHDRFWAALQTALLDHGVSAPSRLSDPVDLPKVWLRDDLCFSQTCSLPLRTRLRDQVTLIATPDYGLSGAPAGHYYSVFVARADDPRDAPAAFADAPFAFNEPSSHSAGVRRGNLPNATALPSRTPFKPAAIAPQRVPLPEGQADLCALDAITWTLIQRYDPFAAKLRVVGRSGASPALPYITARHNDPEPFCAALSQTLPSLPDECRDTLMLRSIKKLSLSAYMDLPIPPAPPSPLPV